MNRTTIRCASAAAAVCVIMFSGCAGTTGTSAEQRILTDYAQVSKARASVNDKLAQGTLSKEDWHMATNGIDAAGASLDSSMAAINRRSMHEAEVAMAASEAILRDKMQATK